MVLLYITSMSISTEPLRSQVAVLTPVNRFKPSLLTHSYASGDGINRALLLLSARRLCSGRRTALKHARFVLFILHVFILSGNVSE